MAIPAKDKGYSWVILAASTALSILVSSYYSTFGIYYVEFLEYFEADKTELSWIGACQMVMVGVAGAYLPYNNFPSLSTSQTDPTALVCCNHCHSLTNKMPPSLSLCLFLPGFCSGPIIKAYGCRILITLGSAFLAVGYIPSAFTHNYYVLYFTLGILTGKCDNCSRDEVGQLR